MLIIHLANFLWLLNATFYVKDNNFMIGVTVQVRDSPILDDIIVSADGCNIDNRTLSTCCTGWLSTSVNYLYVVFSE